MARRSVLLSLVLLAATVLFVAGVARSEAPSRWLFFSYAQAWAWTGVFVAACLATGHVILTRVVGHSLPHDEQLTIAMPLGVLAFFVLAFVSGLLGLYGRVYFYALPLSLLAFGGAKTWNDAQRWWRRTRALVWRLELTPLGLLLLGLGLAGFALVWFPTLNPQNASLDARWYHLPVAENYATQGSIRPFAEGWVLGAYPQLASLIYCWAWLAPASLFVRAELAAQIEVALFVVTLFGITACLRRVLGVRAPLAWAGLFLFPGVFCYDSGLVLGADHIAASFAPAILLLSLRLASHGSHRTAALLGACLAGALDTKYSAAILAPLPLVALVLAWRTRSRWQSHAALVGAFALALVVLTSPHWLKNLAYYGDPLFPRLRAWLPAHPWRSIADAPFLASNALARPTTLSSGLAAMPKTLLTFAFQPHDFSSFHGDVPVFGALFSLTTPLCIFVGRRRPLLLIYGATYLGIGAWFWLHTFDRYLQVLVPWMAVGTVAVLMQLWRAGPLVRASSSLLVALQVIWGASVPFLPTHHGVGGSILSATIHLLGDRNGPRPPVAFPGWEELGRALPPGARVLVHGADEHVGLAAPSVTDYPGDQGALYWGDEDAATPRQVWRKLRELGVSHVVWAEHRDPGNDSVAGALVFFDFVAHHTRRLEKAGGFTLAALSDTAPPARTPAEVAYFGCGDGLALAPGLYSLADLARFPGDGGKRPEPHGTFSRAEALERADYAVYDVSCQGPLERDVASKLELLAARGKAMLFQHRSAREK